MKVKTLILIIFGMLILSASNLNAEIKPGRYSLSTFFGSYFFDKDLNVRDTVTYGASLGYDISERWGIEGSLNLNRLNPKSKTGGANVNGYLGRLDALYYFLPKQKFVPYLAMGIGGMSLYEPGSDNNSELIGNYGLGMKYFFNDKIAFRADARHVIASRSEAGHVENNFLYTIGVSFLFGGEKEVEVMPAPQKDSDGDGVPDYQDQCPNTPAGVKVDGRGCPLDSDKDGVPDYQDQCPNTPAGIKVDSKGCPPDSDGDGVLDYLDQCPNTPKGAVVDQRGCWVLKGLNFDTATADIKPAYFIILDDIISVLEKNPSLKIEIVGHTDNVGSADYNENLSLKRAQAVMDYIVTKGIAQDRLSAKGFGFSNPAASNETPEGRAENRWVELKPIQ